jgi:hypothetical protein
MSPAHREVAIMNNKMVLLGVDAAVAAGLMALLVAVIGLDTLLTYLNPPSAASGNDPNTTTSTTKTKTKRTRLAVTEPYKDPFSPQLGTWDDVGKLLDSMGDGYKYDYIKETDLNDLDKLKQFDVVFCSCSAAKSPEAVAKTLHSYVAQGGTLYASDWRYDVVAEAFPEVRDSNLAGLGVDTVVNADVVDPGLREIVGPKFELKFELDSWKTAAFSGDRDRVQVMLRGKYTDKFTGSSRVVPLLVKFKYGSGNVIFTSYHHGKHNSVAEEKLLKYLVHKLITARQEMEIEETLHKNKFSPAKSNLFSASKEAPQQKYTHNNPEPGKLRFDVLFANEAGAEIKLTVKSPSGKSYEKQSTSSFVLEVANAEAGNWTYTITALQVPTADFNCDTRVSHSKAK